MKLIAPGVGWAMATGSRLLWTENGGTDWRDITPPLEGIADIFFIDTHKGWATSKRNGSPPSDELQLDLASTTDRARWSVTHVTLSLKDYELSRDDVSGYKAGPISFVDPLHGWMGVQVEGQSMHNWWSFLLVTSDGGRTWHRAPRAPLLEDPEMLLVTPTYGWMVGDQDVPREKLYFTRDGAKSWKEVSLGAPKEILPADQPTYDLPVFEDSKHGFEAVTYTGGGGVKSAAVLFATVDSGLTWNPDRILKNLEPGSVGETMQSAVTGSTWVTAAVLNHHPMLSTLGPGATIDANIPAGTRLSGYFQASQLSFATPTQGWVLTVYGKLQSTNDGGTTWTDITPEPH